MTHIACRVCPADVCIVPERREELTTEGGLDAAGQLEALSRVVAPLRAAGIRVSLFIDPEERQIEAARRLDADAIEIHTGAYADAATEPARAAELQRIGDAAQRAHAAGLIVNAGHGLTLDNVEPIAAISVIHELNIGHSIVADALFFGLKEAVRRMKGRMLAARGVW
jgi:pyridoxine 5-phosphate synthase